MKYSKNVVKVSRSHLIKNLSEKYLELSPEVIAIAVKEVFDSMTKALAQGYKIELRGFGSFSLRFRSARLARNPKTSQKVNMASRYVIHFKPGKKLSAKINDTK